MDQPRVRESRAVCGVDAAAEEVALAAWWRAGGGRPRVRSADELVPRGEYWACAAGDRRVGL